MNSLITIENCKNCGQNVENHNFCPNCGAKKITNRITPKHLISEFIERFFNLDNSFIRTFIHLFTKPEEVIGGYINGLRKRYIHAFGYFAISVTITGLYAFIIKDRLNEIMKFGNSSELQTQIQDSLLDTTFQYQSLLSFLLIPILAILSRLIFWNYKKYNLAEHFVIYLYAYSHIVGTLAILLLPLTFIVDNFLFIGMIQFPVYIVYMTYVLKRLYQISLKKIILKTLFFLFLGGIFYIIISFIIFGLMIITGTIDIPTK